MTKLQGTVQYNGSIGFIPQQAWLKNMTIKENILFYKELDQKKYDNIIDICQLVVFRN